MLVFYFDGQGPKGVMSVKLLHKRNSSVWFPFTAVHHLSSDIFHGVFNKAVRVLRNVFTLWCMAMIIIIEMTDKILSKIDKPNANFLDQTKSESRWTTSCFLLMVLWGLCRGPGGGAVDTSFTGMSLVWPSWGLNPQPDAQPLIGNPLRL